MLGLLGQSYGAGAQVSVERWYSDEKMCPAASYSGELIHSIPSPLAFYREGEKSYGVTLYSPQPSNCYLILERWGWAWLKCSTQLVLLQCMVIRTGYFYASSSWYMDPNNWIPSFAKRDDINIDLGSKIYIGNKLILQGSFHHILSI
jgi:hypothetical protein